MRFQRIRGLAATLLGVLAAAAAGAAPAPFAITPAPRGASITTPAYSASISNGVVTSFVNAYTGEEYIDGASPERILTHLPSGLGTQAGDAELAMAARLYDRPWADHDPGLTWSNQHFATAASRFEFTPLAANACRLTYRGLGDGVRTFPDETYSIDVTVDGPTGDLLLRPAAASPRKGVYAANLTLATLMPAVTVEAPILDGIRLDRDMPRRLWVNNWGGFWDHGFAALNGRRRGAVGIWTEDAALRYHKALFYLVNEEGLSLAFSGMNVPPFDELTGAGALTWRLQAFDTGWAQAAARFRAWRQANVAMAPRPEWAHRIAFVNNGTTAAADSLAIMKTYLASQHLDRTAYVATAVRRSAAGPADWDNAPYQGFVEDMTAWKASGIKLMAALQPMAIAGYPATDNAGFMRIYAWHTDANTRSCFTPGTNVVRAYLDQHHLGHADWQDWFLSCVSLYVQEYAADGVFHSQAFACPIDRRGPAAALQGMTSPQGMADYFLKAATRSPNAIHGAEHLTEINSVGASLGAGAGITWGDAATIRRQRIRKASPVSNALNYPNAAIWGFPRGAEVTRAAMLAYHQGMDLAERRGDLPGGFLQSPLFSGAIPFDHWVNELALDRRRALAFVAHGLRAVFPEAWDRSVLTYFRGAAGEDFRYVQHDWGTAFVQVANGVDTPLYGRLHGARSAPVAGAVPGWFFYNPRGPAGLLPGRYYCWDPDGARPETCFAPGNWQSPDNLWESFVDDAYATEHFAYLRIRPDPDLGAVFATDTVRLYSRKPPRTIIAGGIAMDPERAKTTPKDGAPFWSIPVRTPGDVIAIFGGPQPGLAHVQETLLVRAVSSDMNSDLVSSRWLGGRAGYRKDEAADRWTLTTEGVSPYFEGRITQVHFLFTPPPGAAAGTLRLQPSCARLLDVLANGVAAPFVPARAGAAPVDIAMTNGAPTLVQLMAAGPLDSCTLEWLEKETP